MFEKVSDDERVSNNSRKLYPDFYKNDFILDAKYKHLNNGVGREDLYQVVTYMYCTKYNNGAYVYPLETVEQIARFRLNGYGGMLQIIPFHIPQTATDFNTFVEEIKKSETSLRKYFSA